MDNKTILMVVVAIVLGMLVANMFKEVCGCKNLIEGQCPSDSDDGTCEWNPSGRLFTFDGQDYGGTSCKNLYSSTLILHGDPCRTPDGTSSSPYWSEDGGVTGSSLDAPSLNPVYVVENADDVLNSGRQMRQIALNSQILDNTDQTVPNTWSETQCCTWIPDQGSGCNNYLPDTECQTSVIRVSSELIWNYMMRTYFRVPLSGPADMPIEPTYQGMRSSEGRAVRDRYSFQIDDTFSFLEGAKLSEIEITNLFEDPDGTSTLAKPLFLSDYSLDVVIMGLLYMNVPIVVYGAISPDDQGFARVTTGIPIMVDPDDSSIYRIAQIANPGSTYPTIPNVFSGFKFPDQSGDQDYDSYPHIGDDGTLVLPGMNSDMASFLTLLTCEFLYSDGAGKGGQCNQMCGYCSGDDPSRSSLNSGGSSNSITVIGGEPELRDGCIVSTGTPQLPASGMIMINNMADLIPSTLSDKNDNTCSIEGMGHHCQSITDCSEKPTDYQGDGDRWKHYCNTCCGTGT